MAVVRAPVVPSADGWLRTVRLALGLSQTSVSTKAGITQQAYAQFETGEASSTISLGRLRHAAAAMDCELVYFLIPRQERAESFTKLASRLDSDSGVSPAAEKAKEHWSRVEGNLPVELL